MGLWAIFQSIAVQLIAGTKGFTFARRQRRPATRCREWSSPSHGRGARVVSPRGLTHLGPWAFHVFGLVSKDMPTVLLPINICAVTIPALLWFGILICMLHFLSSLLHLAPTAGAPADAAPWGVSHSHPHPRGPSLRGLRCQLRGLVS